GQTGPKPTGGDAVDQDELTREDQLRRAAQRKGLRLSKSDDGRYTIEGLHSDAAGESAVDLDLDEVEQALFQPQPRDHPLARDEDYENAITPHAPHDGHW